MKIDINKIKTTPAEFGFNFCVFGKPSQEIIGWAHYWGFKLVESGPFTNIMINEMTDIGIIFNDLKPYQYIDGFSPNLNKNLHVGHFSNLIIANALQKLGVGKKFVAIFGDTLEGSVNPEVALANYEKHCKNFNYHVDDYYFASLMDTLDNKSLLTDGEGPYEGVKVFDLGDEKLVGIKSNGATTYFFQDVALAEWLNDSTLYLTGIEQDNHFKSLKKLFPQTNHLGLGLVLLDGKKMSSSEGNVIYMDEFIDELMIKFNNDIKLVYNIIAGQILKSTPKSNKSIDTNLISNPKLSLGLYLSYTMAHIKSCGVSTKDIKDFASKELKFNELKSRIGLSPNILFEALVNHCKTINKLYETHYIKDNPENIELFSNLISDLELGMKKLGLFSIDKV
jgi:arginyl-tRNA synthetase